MKSSCLLALPLIVALSAVPARAVSITYDLTGIDLSVNTSDPGLVVETEILALPSSFSLDDGESFTFAAFKIWTEETSVNADDRVAKDASAKFLFTSPGYNDAAEGITRGRTGLLVQEGILRWNNPTIVVTAWATYQIELEDVDFNQGLFSLTPGKHHGAIVKATITQLSSAVVPEPGTAVMAALGAGSVGLLTAVRRRRSLVA